MDWGGITDGEATTTSVVASPPGRTSNRLRVVLACLSSTLLLGSTMRAQPHIAIEDASWHLESSSDGILLYSGSVAGVGIVPLKVVMTIPGTIEEVSLVLEDIPRRGEWISNFSQSVLLERTNDY